MSRQCTFDNCRSCESETRQCDCHLPEWKREFREQFELIATADGKPFKTGDVFNSMASLQDIETFIEEQIATTCKTGFKAT